MAMTALSLDFDSASLGPIAYARDTTSSYVRKNYALAQAVYRAQAIRRIGGVQAARTFLLCAGAEARLIDRVLSAPSANRRR
jgi:hypothetical protein